MGPRARARARHVHRLPLLPLLQMLRVLLLVLLLLRRRLMQPVWLSQGLLLKLCLRLDPVLVHSSTRACWQPTLCLLLLLSHSRWLLRPLLHRSTQSPLLLRCQLLLLPRLGPGRMGVDCGRRLHLLGWWMAQHGGWRHLQWDLGAGRRCSMRRPALL